MPRRPLDLDPFRGPSWLDRVVLPFVRESTLWPVLAVVVAHVVAFLAPVLLLAVRDGVLAAGIVAALAAAASAYALGREWRRERRPGAWTGLLAATWSLAIAAAWAASHWGLF